MKLSLPSVTLVMVETREHELARLAIEDCIAVADFGEVLVLSDKSFKDCRYHQVQDWPTKLGWSRSWWFDVPPLLRTSHTLNIQWDSWVYDPSMWTDEFLQYDYIGAPWWYKDGKNVGNGGFSLVSTALKRYIYDRRDRFPCNTSVDDDLLCRGYRSQLESAGFRWAPEPVAHHFAFECCRSTKSSFGFHGMFNWPDVLSEDRLAERMTLAKQSPYISNPDGHFMKAFRQRQKDRTDGRNISVSG